MLKACPNDLGPVTFFRKDLHYLFFVFGTEGFERDTKLHSRIPVCGNELIVLELDDIAQGLCDSIGDGRKLSGLVGKEHGDRKYPVSHDEAVLNDG